MATATTTPHDRMRPLDRLRGYIRAYVSLESAIQICLFLFLWFWLGLVADFGVFKLTGLDWVQSLPWWGFRAAILAVLSLGLASLIYFQLIRRVWRDYSDRSLAMALERSFPAQLGDRLITAVELADPTVSDRYRYSRQMVENTIDEARDRLASLPIEDVFDWSRLRKLFGTLAAASLGVFLIVALSVCTIGRKSWEEFYVRFGQTAMIWFERNVLLQNTIWPRKAYLELVGFPASGELRIGRDSEEKLVVRSLKWIIADRATSEGWRAMRVDDLNANVLGYPPRLDLVPQGRESMTLDSFEVWLDRGETQVELGADSFLYWRQVMQHLRERAESPRMARKIRLLQVPEQVAVYYHGETVRSEQSLDRKESNEFTARLAELRESSRFTVKALDYKTAWRRITIVPPPGLTELWRYEEQPAYLYQRPPLEGTAADLKGKYQLFANQQVSLSGNVSRIDVPTGTNLELRGVVDKALAIADPSAVPPIPPGVQVKPLKGSGLFTPKVHWKDREFTIRIDRVTHPIAFDIVLHDPDRVVSTRQIQIKPIDDSPPDVDIAVEIVRKTRDGYMVTPSARIPISGRVRDDRGLESVDYSYTITPLDAQTAAVGPVISLIHGPVEGFSGVLMEVGLLGWVTRMTKAIGDDSAKTPQLRPVGVFARKLQEVGPPALPLAMLREALSKAPVKPLYRDLALDPEEESFDVGKLELKLSDEREIQPRYRMKLSVIARDGNVETGPGIGESKERLTFLVVSENELLAEIAKDEEALHQKLEETVNKLKEARDKLDRIGQELPALKPEEFSPMARRGEELMETLSRASDTSQDVHRSYLRILSELKINRIQPKIVDKVEKNICEPLEGAVRAEFPASERSMQAFYKTLEASKADPIAMAAAREDLNRLIERLLRILDAMGDITTINKLIQQLANIERAERTASERFKEIYDRMREDLLDQALTPPKKP